MIVYNTTYSVATDVAEDWVRWMKRFYVPAALGTKLPVNHRVLRLLTELDNGGTTYSVQLDFAALADYETYLELHADTLRQRIQHRFGNQYISFDTLLEEL